MKSITFKRNSWHYKLARAWNSSITFDDSISICEYVKAVICQISALLLRILPFVLIIFLTGTESIAKFSWWHQFRTGRSIWIQLIVPFGIGVLIWTIISCATIALFHWILPAFKFIAPKISSRKLSRSSYEPSFIAAAYQSFKTRTCIKVEFEND